MAGSPPPRRKLTHLEGEAPGNERNAMALNEADVPIPGVRGVTLAYKTAQVLVTATYDFGSELSALSGRPRRDGAVGPQRSTVWRLRLGKHLARVSAAAAFSGLPALCGLLWLVS